MCALPRAKRVRKDAFPRFTKVHFQGWKSATARKGAFPLPRSARVHFQGCIPGLLALSTCWPDGVAEWHRNQTPCLYRTERRHFTLWFLSWEKCEVPLRRTRPKALQKFPQDTTCCLIALIRQSEPQKCPTFLHIDVRSDGGERENKWGVWTKSALLKKVRWGEAVGRILFCCNERLSIWIMEVVWGRFPHRSSQK